MTDMSDKDELQTDGQHGDYQKDAYVFPASFAQQRLWFLDQLEPESTVYNINMALRLHGPLDTDALQHALSDLVARHESLRTTFATEEKVPVQVIADTGNISIQKESLQDNDQAIHARLTELAAQGFDLARGPLLRVHLIELSNDAHVLMIIIHHIIADAWSLDIIYREIVALYEGHSAAKAADLPELPIQYADYTDWLADWLDGEQLENQLKYWRTQLADAPAMLELPTDRPRPRRQTFTGAYRTRRLSDTLTLQLRSLAQAQSCTLFVLLLAAYNILMSRYTTSDDIVIGTPIGGRNRKELEDIIGLFVNTIALRGDLSGDPSFTELLTRVKQATLSAFTHQELPFEKIVEDLQPERDMSHTPIFQTLFVLTHAGTNTAKFSSMTTESITVQSGTAKFDLSLYVTESSDELTTIFEYNTDLFDAVTIDRMLTHLETLLGGIVSNPDSTISQIPLLDDDERQQVLTEFNDSAMDVANLSVTALFEQQAGSTPNATAVVMGDESLTYQQLNARANRLARHLAACGTAPDSLVGIACERSIEAIVGILAILKSGAAYVPIDPNYPAERISYMLSDSRAPVLLTQSTLLAQLPETSATIVCLDNFDWHSGDTSNLGVDSESLYAIYTSGSTGQPKGVKLTHAGLSNLLQWQATQPGLNEPARTLQFASLSFDVSFQELFSTWTQGGTLVLIDEELRRDLPALAKFIATDSIERVYLPYAALQPLADNILSTDLPYSVRDVIVAGEQLQITPSIRKMFTALNATRLHNQYGPSETHVVTAHTLSGAPADWPALPPIGTPVANTRVYALDTNQVPTAIGVPGELYIGGVQVASGYLGRPELTAEKFLPDPFIPGQQIYKTGDRVRFLANGNIEYLGRTDDQIKWRGFRIEPGEIEARLTEHESVQHAAVLLREDIPGDKRLVAYIVAAQDQTMDTEIVSTWLREQVPEYMVPSSFMTLQAMPLTASGKIARRKLPLPDYAESKQAYVAPRTPIEEALVQIWIDVLGTDRIGVHDNFFALGGHSLLATQLISRVRDALDVELPLISLFNHPSVASFATELEGITGADIQETILPRDPELPVPLSFSQQRLWFLDQLEPENPAYNFPVALKISGNLDRDALQTSIDALVARHESLRTIFAVTDNQPVQVIADSANIRVEYTDFGAGPEQTLQDHLTTLSQSHFDLEQGPLLRVFLLRRSDQQHVLLIVAHHIITDGWSLDVLMSEFAQLYTAAHAGVTATLPKLPLQYGDYAVWQKDWFTGAELEKQLRFWRDQLADAPAAINLPLDRPRPPEQSFSGASVVRWLPQGLANDLNAVARDNTSTLFMVLLAAFNILLSRYSGEDDIVVGSPIAGRKRTELEALVGFFTNTLVMRTDLSGDPLFTELLARVRQTSLDAYAHQDLPFEKLVEELQPERAMSHSPMFQVMFVLQNMPAATLNFGDLEVTGLPFEMGIAKFDLLFEIAETEAGLRSGIQYNSDLFEAHTIECMLDHFQTLLEGVAANPGRSISTLALLDTTERQHILTDFNATTTAYPHDRVHTLVEDQVASQPDAVALRFADHDISYRELNERANRLAHTLIAAGAGPGHLVGICAERHPNTAIAVLAVLKAGAAYVPIDPDYPAERVAYMLEDSHAPVLLTHSQLLTELPAHSARTICLDEFDFRSGPADNPGERAGPKDPVYAIYTSGSTGKPKGVLLSHDGLANLIQWQATQPGLGDAATTLQFASFSFDVSFQELFTTWATGGKLIMLSDELRRDFPALTKFIATERIERVYLPYAALQPLADSVVTDKNLNYAIKDVIVAGEQLQLTPPIRQMFEVLNGARLHNQYGPSETHVVTAYTLTKEIGQWMPLPPIGTPVANTSAYVLDGNRQVVPVGIPGELYLGGKQVALGYHERAELTADKFLADPFAANPDARIYRTGDRVRFLPDGNLEYLGRTDDQVKWRGFRIEPGEIEAVLAEHESVQQAVVMLREDQPGDKRLVAYALPVKGEVIDATLRNWLQEQLPDYMVPSAFVTLDTMPLTPSGKIARRKLPAPDYTADATAYVAPRTEVELALVEIWAPILGAEQIGIHDDFFTLGGHSLLATQLVSRIRDSLGIELPLKLIFKHSTPETLAEAITAMQVTSDVIDSEDDTDREEFSI